MTTTTDELHERVENDFTYHAPDDEARRSHEDVREVLRDAAHYLIDRLPAGRARSTALTKLEEAMFWSNAAIARHGTTLVTHRTPPDARETASSTPDGVITDPTTEAEYGRSR